MNSAVWGHFGLAVALGLLVGCGDSGRHGGLRSCSSDVACLPGSTCTADSEVGSSVCVDNSTEVVDHVDAKTESDAPADGAAMGLDAPEPSDGDAWAGDLPAPPPDGGAGDGDDGLSSAPDGGPIDPCAGGCNDAVECTVDTCDPGVGCVHEPVDAACNDGAVCTTDTCEASLGCQNAPTTEPCDDGDSCTLADTCKDGLCTGIPDCCEANADCEDDNPCTLGSCSAQKKCQYADKPDSSACSDIDACTLGDACLAGACVGEPVVLDCDDADPCTNDGCDPLTGACGHTFNTAPCDDGNACTTDTCAAGSCGVPVGSGVPCDDDDQCTVFDVCQAATCAGVPADTADFCDDGNFCTVDACDPVAGCTHTSVDVGTACGPDKSCGGGACLPNIAPMALIPKGEFWMGCVPGDTECQNNEAPQHRVLLSTFYIDLAEVSVAEYAVCVTSGTCVKPLDAAPCVPAQTSPYTPRPECAQLPVTSVTWEQARAYCQWRGPDFDLPTEAQWERAARGGCDGAPTECAASVNKWPWGTTKPTCGVAVMAEDGATVAGRGQGVPGIVASRSAGRSPYGAFDMAGNVAEFTRDYVASSEALGYVLDEGEIPVDPTGPNAGSKVRVRGGSYWGTSAYLRTSARNTGYAADGGTGFRCVRRVNPAEVSAGKAVEPTAAAWPSGADGPLTVAAGESHVLNANFRDPPVWDFASCNISGTLMIFGTRPWVIISCAGSLVLDGTLEMTSSYDLPEYTDSAQPDETGALTGAPLQRVAYTLAGGKGGVSLGGAAAFGNGGGGSAGSTKFYPGPLGGTWGPHPEGGGGASSDATSNAGGSGGFGGLKDGGRGSSSMWSSGLAGGGWTNGQQCLTWELAGSGGGGGFRGRSAGNLLLKVGGHVTGTGTVHMRGLRGSGGGTGGAGGYCYMAFGKDALVGSYGNGGGGGSGGAGGKLVIRSTGTVTLPLESIDLSGGLGGPGGAGTGGGALQGNEGNSGSSGPAGVVEVAYSTPSGARGGSCPTDPAGTTCAIGNACLPIADASFCSATCQHDSDCNGGGLPPSVCATVGSASLCVVRCGATIGCDRPDFACNEAGGYCAPM